MHELFEHGIEMALFTRTGRLVGQITSPSTKNIELRIEQFKRYWEEGFRTSLSKIIVSGKVANCLSIIRAFSYNHPEISFAEEVGGMESSLKRVAEAQNTASLTGIEGGAAKSYFKGFGKMILGGFTFAGRKKHPATDPVNALLSFGYTLVFNELSSLLDGLGFDPYLGYFHKVDYGRASLASDLLEEFRASIDRFTLYLLNTRIVQGDNFFQNQETGGMYLTRDAMRIYFREYEKVLEHEFAHGDTGEQTTLRKCFRMQAERLANAIKGVSEYATFKVVT